MPAKLLVSNSFLISIFFKKNIFAPFDAFYFFFQIEDGHRPSASACKASVRRRKCERPSEEVEENVHGTQVLHSTHHSHGIQQTGRFFFL